MALGLTLALTAALLWSASNLLDKALVEQVFKRPLSYMAALLLIDLPIGLVVIGVFHLGLPTPDLIRVVIGCIFGLTASYLYLRALQHDEVSRVVPLFATSTLMLTLLGAIFLGERFAWTSYVGIILVVVGAWVVQVRGSVLSPFRSRSLWLMLLAALFWPAEITMFKPVIDAHGSFAVTTFAITINGAAGAAAFLFIWRTIVSEIRSSIGFRRAWIIAGNEVIAATAYYVYFAAVGLWFASLVSAAGSVQYLFVYLLALLIAPAFPKIFKEERHMGVGLRRSAAIIAIIIGVALLT